ncbi:hypothetical protein B0E33_01310 [Roseibium algicola]|uniref:NusG-like N-terminal domain-containing protein n=2 Tax=Roseibium algicola TaxID=2857014 RepID=A0ABN4WT43_9HYPH|nr:hypothetical protein B0E33_01310 [Roseibium aggregatum]
MEARAIEDLLELNIRAYCPHGLYERRVGKARRREDFTRPLFTSYVLAGLDPAEPPLGVVVGLDSVVAIVSIDQEQPAWVSWSHVERIFLARFHLVLAVGFDALKAPRTGARHAPALKPAVMQFAACPVV